MFEDDPGRPALAEDLPDLLAEPAGLRAPCLGGRRVGDVGQPAPVAELLAVDEAFGAELHAEPAALLVGDHGDRDAAAEPDDLDGHGAEAAGTAPDEDRVARADGVRLPAAQLPVGGGGGDDEAAGVLPGQGGGLGVALVLVDQGVLRERAVVGLVAPGLEGLGPQRVGAQADVLGGLVPLGARHDDLVADLHVLDALADGPDDAGAVGAADVEVLGGAEHLLPHPDHVDRRAERRPHVVVVDAGGHDVHQHLAAARPGRVDDLGAKGLLRLSEAVLPNDRRIHPFRDFTERRNLSDFIQRLGHVHHSQGVDGECRWSARIRSHSFGQCHRRPGPLASHAIRAARDGTTP